MEHKALSIRPFIGAKNFELSRNFYRDLGFQEKILTPIREDHWGKECFVHDPSGILWHFGEFNALPSTL